VIDKNKLYKKIGENLKYYRKLKGFSQDNLSYASNVCRGYFGRCERGENHPSVSTIYKISRALEVPLYKFFVFDKEIEE